MTARDLRVRFWGEFYFAAMVVGILASIDYSEPEGLAWAVAAAVIFGGGWLLQPVVRSGKATAAEVE
jgi:hypothetical protein